MFFCPTLSSGRSNTLWKRRENLFMLLPSRKQRERTSPRTSPTRSCQQCTSERPKLGSCPEFRTSGPARCFPGWSPPRVPESGPAGGGGGTVVTLVPGNPAMPGSPHPPVHLLALGFSRSRCRRRSSGPYQPRWVDRWEDPEGDGRELGSPRGGRPRGWPARPPSAPSLFLPGGGDG